MGHWGTSTIQPITSWKATISNPTRYYTGGMARYPIVPGHEWAGEVASLGSAVQGFEVGQRVVGEVCRAYTRDTVFSATEKHHIVTHRRRNLLNTATATTIDIPDKAYRTLPP